MRSAEDLVDAVVSPGSLVRYRVPLEHTERRRVRGSTKTCLALGERFLREFTAGDVEIDAKDAVRPDVRVAAEPPYRSIRHEKAELMVIGFTLTHSLLFGITCAQVFERHPLAHQLDRDDLRVLGKSKQARLLHIDASFCSCDVDLEGSHAGRFQGQS